MLNNLQNKLRKINSGPVPINFNITFLSMSWSHMSFIVHPAPLMITAPKPKRANICKSGNAPGGAAIAMLHPHGQNNNQDPVIEVKVNLLYQKRD